MSANTVDLARPIRRLPVRGWNAVGRLLGWSSPRDSALAIGPLLEAAIRRTGLTDLGDESFREPLTRLLDAANTSAALHAFGRQAARWMITELLCNRLRVEDAWRRHPELGHVVITAPTIILGPPRSGTTLLLNLLACDPDHRTLTHWEGTQPVAGSGGFGTRPVRRLRSAIGLQLNYYLSPPLRVIREAHVDGPDEGTALLLANFTSQAFAGPLDAGAYLDWLDERDYSASLRYHRRQLTALQERPATRRWLLKSPHFLPALRAVLDAYPDAHVIHMHRDPASVLPSAASLTAAFRAVFTERLDGADIGAQTARLVANGLRRAAAARRDDDGHRVVDVQYADLTRDPIGVVRQVYGRLGLPLPMRMLDRMQAWLAAAGAWRSRHRYSLEPFGLDAGRIDREFAWYRARFAVPKEHAHVTP